MYVAYAALPSHAFVAGSSCIAYLIFAVKSYSHGGLLKAHGCAVLSELPGCLAILDDFGRTPGVPRVASIMTKEGFPAERILSPNRDQIDVVQASLAMNVRSVQK